MKQHKSVSDATAQNKSKVTLFSPIKQKDRGVMRPGKTKKDKLVTKSWYNRIPNQQARADKVKGGR